MYPEIAIAVGFISLTFLWLLYAFKGKIRRKINNIIDHMDPPFDMYEYDDFYFHAIILISAISAFAFGFGAVIVAGIYDLILAALAAESIIPFTVLCLFIAIAFSGIFGIRNNKKRKAMRELRDTEV